jgi:hypothetical protein
MKLLGFLSPLPLFTKAKMRLRTKGAMHGLVWVHISFS